MSFLVCIYHIGVRLVYCQMLQTHPLALRVSVQRLASTTLESGPIVTLLSKALTTGFDSNTTGVGVGEKNR